MQLAHRVSALNTHFDPETPTVVASNATPVVFVVDDDRLLGTSVKRFLESRKCTAAYFEDPQSFLEHLPRNPHGCVLLDVNMGSMSGFDVARELERRGCKMPIIFISGDTNVATVVEAMKRGAFHFFPKPANPEALHEVILRAIEHDRQAFDQRMQRQALLARAALLTPREMHVARLVATGMLNKQIASELGIVEKTVKVHRGRVVEKLRVGSVADLVRFIDAIDNSGESPNLDDA